MNKKMITLIALLLSTLVVFASGGSGGGGLTVTEGFLTMGTNAQFPPFESIGGALGDEVVGFDVEIAKAIAAEAGLTLRIEDMGFDSLIPALKSGKIDMIVAGMTITPLRRESVDFSDPYFTATQAVLVAGDSDVDYKTKDDLAGKVIGVQLGTTGNEIADKISGARVVSFKAAFEAILDLKNQGVDAVIIDEAPAQVFLSKNPGIKRVPMEFETEYYGIAVQKGSAEMLGLINQTLKKLRDTGEYDRLIEQFFGSESAAPAE